MLVHTGSFQSSFGQTDTGNTTTEEGVITSSGTFASPLDLFLVPESVGGYGVYEEHVSNTFTPGEDMVL